MQTDAGAIKRGRRYRATPEASLAATFHCGAVAFDLELLVARVDGELVGVRPQEARLLALLLRADGHVVTYEELSDLLYGERIPPDACRARLKSLVADLRRRFGTDMQAALRTATGKGLVLRLPGSASARCLQVCCDTGAKCAASVALNSQCLARARFAPRAASRPFLTNF